MEIELYADVNPEENIFELISDPNETPLEDGAYKAELVMFLKVALSRLNKKEREVILYRFGFMGNIPSQREVAPKVGFSSYGGVDYAEGRALNTLGRFFRRIGVEL